MATIEQLEQDNKNYSSISSDVGDIIVYLESAINELESLSNNVAIRYTVDDNSTPIITRIDDLKKEIEKVNTYLKTNVKTSIDTSIQSNKLKISSLREAEQKAKEEEEKKKKEAEEAATTTSYSSSSSSSSSSTGYSKPISAPKKEDSKKNDKWDKW